LKKLVLQAVPSTFTEILSDTVLGYARVKTIAILNHLATKYGTITEDDLNQNIIKMNSAFNIQQPIDKLFTRLLKYKAFSAAKDPISEATMVRDGLTILDSTASFTIAISEWRKKNEADKTFDNFQTHFKIADDERRRLTTTRGAGYHQAAQVNGPPLANTNKPAEGWYYCWSHGVTRNAEYTSATCNRHATGHRSEATMGNMLGGCNIVQRRRGKTPVFVRQARTKPAEPTTAP
jgi:hypothetical protein